jgi:hypothetical protein
VRVGAPMQATNHRSVQSLHCKKKSEAKFLKETHLCCDIVKHSGVCSAQIRCPGGHDASSR